MKFISIFKIDKYNKLFSKYLNNNTIENGNFCKTHLCEVHYKLLTHSFIKYYLYLHKVYLKLILNEKGEEWKIKSR